MSSCPWSWRRVVGRDPRRSTIALLLIAATAGVAYFVAGAVEHVPGYVVVVAAGAVVAASVAAWNDGAATSVLAVVVPAFAWQYHHLTRAVVTGSPGFDAVGIPALVGVPAGLGAYVVGRVVATDGETDSGEWPVGVLVGSHPRVAGWTVAFAATVAVVGSVSVVAFPAFVSRSGPIVPTAAVLAVVAAWTSYEGSGLVPSWLLVGLPVASVGTATWVVTDAQGGLSGAVGGVAFPAAVVALVAGTIAFALGDAARRVRDARTSVASP